MALFPYLKNTLQAMFDEEVNEIIEPRNSYSIIQNITISFK